MNDDVTQSHRFQRRGDVILSDRIPTPRLLAIRDAVEQLIARHRESDSAWDTCPIPRVDMAQQVELATAESIEIAFRTNTLGS